MSACKFNLKCGFVLKPLQHIPWLHTVGGGDFAVVAAKVLSKVPDQASLLGSWLRKAVFSTNQFETDKWSTWFPMRDVTKNHKNQQGTKWVHAHSFHMIRLDCFDVNSNTRLCLNMFKQCFTPCNPAHRLENADSVGYLGLEHVVRVLLKFIGTQISSCRFIWLCWFACVPFS